MNDKLASAAEALAKVERQALDALSTAQDLAKTLDAVPPGRAFVKALRKTVRGLEATAGATADLASMALVAERLQAEARRAQDAAEDPAPE